MWKKLRFRHRRQPLVRTVGLPGRAYEMPGTAFGPEHVPSGAKLELSLRGKLLSGHVERIPAGTSGQVVCRRPSHAAASLIPLNQLIQERGRQEIAPWSFALRAANPASEQSGIIRCINRPQALFRGRDQPDSGSIKVKINKDTLHNAIISPEFVREQGDSGVGVPPRQTPLVRKCQAAISSGVGQAISSS